MRQPFESNAGDQRGSGERRQLPAEEASYAGVSARDRRVPAQPVLGSFRVRSVAAYALHRFFQERGFIYLHAPLITGSDAEEQARCFGSPPWI